MEERQWKEKIEAATDKGPDDYKMLQLLSSGMSLGTIQQYYQDLYIDIWKRRIKVKGC